MRFEADLQFCLVQAWYDDTFFDPVAPQQWDEGVSEHTMAADGWFDLQQGREAAHPAAESHGCRGRGCQRGQGQGQLSALCSLAVCLECSYLPLSHCLISVCMCVVWKPVFKLEMIKLQQQKSTHLFPLVGIFLVICGLNGTSTFLIQYSVVWEHF